jgi:hypothetical protein
MPFDPSHRKVLHLFGQRKRTSFEQADVARTRCVTVKKVLGEH